VVCLVHGLGEHSGRYGHVSETLGKAGYVILAFDQRGHGKTPGRRGHSPSYGALMDDIGRLLEEAARKYPHQPCILYGHSMGGNFIINFALRRKPRLAGVMATAPALKAAFNPPALKVAVGKFMSKVWPGFTMPNGLDLQGLSRDPEVIRLYTSDPLVHDRLSARLGMDILNTGRWALDHAADFPLPLLLMHGSADRLTSVQASREFALKAGESCTLKIWEGFYHEVHNEPEKDEVLTFLITWMNARLSQMSA
jgi:alpha-beta hydrolase superfamily lysophospholipase